jgi:hypothetical protein
MLEHLDTVDWESLSHAYGATTDVPTYLRALLSPDSAQRERAHRHLSGCICHQGTVYPATAAAVPFLYELLAAPDTPDKSSVACLLSYIADGRGYLEVHAVGEWAETTWRKILAEQGKSLEDELEREAAEIRSVRQAVSQRLVFLLPYLEDPDSSIRWSVATALGNYAEHSARSLPALEAAAAKEADGEVRQAMVQSIERLTKRHI